MIFRVTINHLLITSFLSLAVTLIFYFGIEIEFRRVTTSVEPKVKPKPNKFAQPRFTYTTEDPDTIRSGTLRLTQTSINVAIGTIDKSSKKRFLCGGVLVERRLIVSSASCFKGLKASQLVVSDGRQVFQTIQQIILHPKYIQNGYYDDVAVLIVDQSSKKNWTTKNPEDRYVQYLSEADYTYQPYWATNWDYVENFDDNDERQQTRGKWENDGSKTVFSPSLRPVRIVNTAECKMAYIRYFTSIQKNYFNELHKEIDGSLFCISDVDNVCETCGGYQLLAATMSKLSFIQEQGVKYFLLGTRVKAIESQPKFGKEVTTAKPSTFDVEIRKPSLYTNLIHYESWILSHLDDLDYPEQKQKGKNG